MKLWLDDLRPAPAGWVLARDVDMAIAIVEIALREGKTFEFASLDHDMGDNFIHGGDGLAFVDWMIVNNIWPTEKPVVHSMNSAGRERMQRSINRYFPEE